MKLAVALEELAVSLGPLRLGIGRKTANVLAGLARGGLLFAVFLVVALVPLVSDPTEPPGQATLFIVLAAVFGAVCTGVGQVLIRAALGSSRTRGSIAYYSRAQLLMVPLGVAGGLGASAFIHAESSLGTGALIAVALLVGATSVILSIRWSRRLPLPLPPAPGHAMTTATVTDHWDPGIGHRLGAISMSVLSFDDDQGRIWYVRHLHEQSFVPLGMIGAVQFERHRPGCKPRFFPPTRAARGFTLIDAVKDAHG